MRRKQRQRLTPRQKELAAEAFALAGPVIESYRRKHWSGEVDFAGEVALRICQLIPTYDPALAPLSKWAVHQAQFACRDGIRRDVHSPESRYRNRRLRFVSLDAEVGDGETFAALHAGPRVEGCEDHESEVELLCGVREPGRRVLLDSFVGRRTLKEIAADLGLSESRVSQIRAEAVSFLRGRLASRREVRHASAS